MNSVYLSLLLILGAFIAIAVPGGPGAIIICAILTAPILLILNQIDNTYKDFLRNIFIVGLLIRVALAAALYLLDLTYYFGPDSRSYDEFAVDLIKYWDNALYYRYELGIQSSNVAMSYLTAVIYLFIGRNPFALQLFNCVIGAATGLLIFFCAYSIFHNLKVARYSALFATFFPSLILWTSLGLKDGPIIFAIALGMFGTLRLMERLSFIDVITVLLSLVSLLGLRFYVFYLMVISIIGGFLIGSRDLLGIGFIRQIFLLVIVGASVIYMGTLRNTSTEIQHFTDLENLQRTRSWGARVSESGYGKDVDISTMEGAITFLPVGFMFVMFAPFPWQMTSVSQIITLPEMLIWWGTFPLLISGLIYAIRHKLRNAIPIILFNLMLTLIYSLYQNNVGTVYRQRSQLLIFYLIFTAVGIVLWQERKENKSKK
jgi:hypothetical protein